MEYLIIGNGVAGTTAAERIRDNDPSGRIVIVTEEPYPFYSRIMLINYLAGEMGEDALYLKPDSWYKDNSIELLLNSRAERLDTVSRHVILSTGERPGYDRLLIATGGKSFVPPIKDAGKEGVFTIRGLDDAKRVLKYVEQGNKNLILIGGGVLGLEVGNALRKRGCTVTVVEFFPRLLPRHMDPQGAELLQKQMERMGFCFYLGAKSKEVIGRKAVDGLLLEDGRKIEGDIIVVSAGIRPDVELARNAGLKVNRGVVVDDRMETSVHDIYAAGDVAEHNDRLYGIWPAAEQQGEVAGINMAGGSAIYRGTTPSNILKVAGIDLMAAGDIDPEDRNEVYRFRDEERSLYKKLVFQNERLIGFILYGDISERVSLMKALKEGWNKEQVKKEVEWILN
ncbi:MAG: NAD(P)/FAD-dependent oxidoreductase [Nitrospirae bacterium]|nr:NAD(P)/FAD-dependent oxidoreductase [Nitrospirota bacterium]